MPDRALLLAFAPPSSSLALLLASLVLLVGCAGAPRAPVADPVAELRDLEARRTAAMQRADVAALEPLFAPGLRYGHANGVVEDGAALLARLRSGALRYERLDARDLDVTFAGDAALVRGIADVRAKGPAGAIDATLVYLAVYAQTDGRWQLVAYQSAAR
jgi:ketosteroid isomerase-like protein